MLEKAVILLGNHRIDHILGNLVVGNRQAVLDEDLPDLLTGAIQDDAGGLHLGKFLKVKDISLRGIFSHYPTVCRERSQQACHHQNQGHNEPKPEEPWFPAALSPILPTVAMTCDKGFFPRKREK